MQANWPRDDEVSLRVLLQVWGTCLVSMLPLNDNAITMWTGIDALDVMAESSGFFFRAHYMT